jgi:hypothetical protein
MFFLHFCVVSTLASVPTKSSHSAVDYFSLMYNCTENHSYALIFKKALRIIITSAECSLKVDRIRGSFRNMPRLL